MTTAIADRTRVIRAEKAQGHSLRIVPIIGPSHEVPNYRLLDEQSVAFVRITETSAAGSVPELTVQNDAGTCLFS